MNIVMIGTGYVGLVSGACFAEMGNHVTCVDIDREKVDQLNAGKVAIYEPGLEEVISGNRAAGRLAFTADAGPAIAGADIVFICVGTPACPDGSADLSYVYDTARVIGTHVAGYTVVVTKSTVPVGTTEKVSRIIAETLASRKSDAEVEMANNPEFLKEGSAVADFIGPDRVVIGTSSERVRRIMRRLYAAFFRTDERILFMSVPSSELTKYASNCMLATRISFINEIALLAEEVGADVEEIRHGMAGDKRIGKYFLYAGAGYGGSCFPKDVAALIETGRLHGRDMGIICAAEKVNREQKGLIARKMLRFFANDVAGKRIAFWGLSFKPETDDVREAPALEVIRIMREHGAVCAVHDPEGMTNARNALGDEGIVWSEDSYAMLKGANALVVMTEWKQYRTPDWIRIRSLMASPVVFDGRNLYSPEYLAEQGFRYFGVGYGERV